MGTTLQGFHVRPPRADEAAVLAEWFSHSLLGEKDVMYLGAFGQPGDVPLGAVAFRPCNTPDGTPTAGFQIFVRPDCRRRRIGTTLIHRLRELAELNNARRLELAALIHQDSPDNAFYQAMGMSVIRRLRTYVVSGERVRKLCEPLVRRARARGDRQLADSRIVPMNQVQPTTIANFFVAHYGGFVDQRLTDLASGAIDLDISHACLADEQMVGGVLVRSKSAVPSVMVDLILTAPQYRDGPMPLALIAAAELIASVRGIRESVFEGDEQHDRFAVGFANRSGAVAQRCRYRYAIWEE